MHTPYIQRMVNLEPRDYRTVRRHANRKGLGRRGFSAAMRMIIREWEYLTAESNINDSSPPDEMLKDLDLTIS
ncbi:MAG: hypothetical protein A2W33_04580 [Chloroflexi bacterium RBG_16_52_11]|nr:MAG: hypothetical protein A2W33_04580 [Chloroflexi bacterium RBG_16_52_11]